MKMTTEKLKINYKTQKQNLKQSTDRTPLRQPWIQTYQTTDTTQKSSTCIFKISTITNDICEEKCESSSWVYKPRHANVFSQCGSWQHGSTSYQKSLWRVLRSAVYRTQWMCGHALCIKYMKLIVKYFFLADILFWESHLRFG